MSKSLFFCPSFFLFFCPCFISLCLIVGNLLMIGILLSQWYPMIKRIGWIPWNHIIKVHWYFIFIKQIEFDYWIIYIISTSIVTKYYITCIKNYDFSYRQFLNINIMFINNKIYFLCDGKKNIFLERYTILPIKSHISNIFICNDFSQSGNESLYKSFHFSIRHDSFVCRAIYFIAV